MNINKIIWGIRAIIYRLIFKKIGMPSYLGKPILIQNAHNISIGKRFRIYPGMRAEVVTKESYVTIGDNVSIGQNFHVVSYDSELAIGNNVTISGNVLITNCNHSYQQIRMPIMNQSLISKKTKIGDGCFIGYGAVLQAGTILGEQCVVGANAVVKGIYPDYCVIVGAPGRVIKKYDLQTEEWKRVN